MQTLTVNFDHLVLFSQCKMLLKLKISDIIIAENNQKITLALKFLSSKLNINTFHSFLEQSRNVLFVFTF